MVNGNYVVAALTLDLYLSTSGGAGWTNVSQIHNDDSATTHADQHAFAFVPGNSNLYYLGNDGGVYSGNGSVPTSDNTSLAITQFYRGDAAPVGKSTAIGGNQDNGTVSYTGTLGWKRVVSSDGGYAAVDYSNGNNAYGTIAASPAIHFYRSTTGVTGIFSESDNGITTADPAQFIYPTVMDPGTPSTLYLGTNHLYQSTNGGVSWQALPLGNPQTFGASPISAIAVAPSSPTTSRTIYVGTPNGFWSSTNGGAAWNDLSASFPAAGRYISSIAVSPTQSTVAYATVSGYSPSGTGYVWKTTDGGNTWTDLTGNLPNAAASAIQVSPGSTPSLYIADDTGVYESTAGDANWQLLTPGTNGMPGVVVDDVVLNRAGTELFAFTHGRSAYVADITGVAGSGWAWGINNYGQLGANTTQTCHTLPCSTTPIQILGSGGTGTLTGVVAVAAGSQHSLALKNDGTVWAWGDNFHGQLGDGTSTGRSSPVQVVGAGGTGNLTGVSGISAGASFALAWKPDGSAWAWGENDEGELGAGKAKLATCNGIPCSTSPRQVVGSGGSGSLANVSTLVAGSTHALATLNDQSVWAWGSNGYGELGTSSSDSCTNRNACSTTPVQVAGATGAVTLAGGNEFSLAAIP